MRALPLEFPSDPGVRQSLEPIFVRARVAHQPCSVQGDNTAGVYLPAGAGWIDFWTGKRLSGGETITADAPLDRIPIYAKAGSIIPLGPQVESAAAKTDPVELRVYPGADGDFTLYEDEGDTYDYEHGAYSVIPIHWDDKAQTITVGDRKGSFPGMLEHRTFQIIIVKEGHGTGIASTEPDTSIQYDGKAASIHLR